MEAISQKQLKGRTIDSVAPTMLPVVPLSVPRENASLAAQIAQVPCVMMRPGEDEYGAMLRSALLRRHLSEDQRACLGDDLREYQSAIRKSERAAKAAAAKAGSLSSESDDKVVDSRIDSRKEAAIQFKISENKLKSLALIRRHEREHKVPADRARLGGRPRPAGRIIIEAR